MTKSKMNPSKILKRRNLEVSKLPSITKVEEPTKSPIDLDALDQRFIEVMDRADDTLKKYKDHVFLTKSSSQIN